jgi:hypothetical protein
LACIALSYKNACDFLLSGNVSAERVRLPSGSTKKRAGTR